MLCVSTCTEATPSSYDRLLLVTWNLFLRLDFEGGGFLMASHTIMASENLVSGLLIYMLRPDGFRFVLLLR